MSAPVGALMGLMGFARSGIRQHWHIWEVMRDTSEWAVTPALGYAAQVISACVVIFLGLIAFIFWLGGLVEKPALVPKTKPPTGRRDVLVEAGGGI
jgi:cytochrome d ubiquinol oxidase subunit I